MLKAIKGLKPAIKGIKLAFKKEENIKIQFLIALLVTRFALYLQLTKETFLFIILACFLVLILEYINTCFENLIDYIHPSYSKEIGAVKDMMAGVVVLGCLFSFVVGVVIFF